MHLSSHHFCYSFCSAPASTVGVCVCVAAYTNGRGHTFAEPLQARSSSDTHFSSFYLKSALCLYNYTRLGEDIPQNPSSAAPLLTHISLDKWGISRLISDRKRPWLQRKDRKFASPAINMKNHCARAINSECTYYIQHINNASVFLFIVFPKTLFWGDTFYEQENVWEKKKIKSQSGVYPSAFVIMQPIKYWFIFRRGAICALGNNFLLRRSNQLNKY